MTLEHLKFFERNEHCCDGDLAGQDNTLNREGILTEPWGWEEPHEECIPRAPNGCPLKGMKKSRDELRGQIRLPACYHFRGRLSSAHCPLPVHWCLKLFQQGHQSSLTKEQQSLNTHGAGGRYLIYTIVEVTVNTSSFKQGCTNADIDKKENRELKADGDVKWPRERLLGVHFHLDGSDWKEWTFFWAFYNLSGKLLA